ncbi:hypothetical protein SYNPS1DRAFT_24125 [Syncephalis pseudoplumigaleata]|uniref:Uncharacterized protein n=1 Tax=Syncephalis pseudoplumigaleata TaxID=1712513 RepID=A0A4P9YVG8_9FUNG|nr:hypothetical protein SYNPS1DRAFT_24125 [Syncephalis pseudoplumigaleata]|eukprot:RKP23795.1 hypothetical protein SYNPS1DRAFT_24125 [Syncephalis pseudoplumigaleata]
MPVSTGLRYRATQPFVFEVTNIVNPAMGHTSTAYTAAVNPLLTCSTRFDFNLYSYESDLCIGAEWRNGGEGVVKGRLGFRQGLALLFDGRYRNALFSFGLVVDAHQRTNAFFRSIGLQIQYII